MKVFFISTLVFGICHAVNFWQKIPQHNTLLLHSLLKIFLRKHLLFAYSIASHIEILLSTEKLVSDYDTSIY